MFVSNRYKKVQKNSKQKGIESGPTGVEIVHTNVALRSNGVRHGALVLGKLPPPQPAHILHPLDRVARQVRAEPLVAKDSQALLERELEPVPHCDPVSSPVVEVLVSDDAQDALVVAVGGCQRVGEHVGGVEYVEALLGGGTVEIDKCMVGGGWWRGLTRRGGGVGGYGVGIWMYVFVMVVEWYGVMRN